MRIGVGTPLATQSTVWSPSLDVRATRSALAKLDVDPSRLLN